jgi:hypothetical protein
MSGSMEPEKMWHSLLSGSRVLIRAAWNELDSEGQTSVRRHLETMSSGEGWHAAQRAAARTALLCIEHGPEDEAPGKPDASNPRSAPKIGAEPGGHNGG